MLIQWCVLACDEIVYMAQAQYTLSDSSRLQLQQCLDAFRGQSFGIADAADSQRRSVLRAQAMHFLQPQNVQVSSRALLGSFALQIERRMLT